MLRFPHSNPNIPTQSTPHDRGHLYDNQYEMDNEIIYMDLDREPSIGNSTSNLVHEEEALIVMNSTNAFGGDSDDSDVEQIQFNPKSYFLELIAHHLNQEESLPGDNPKNFKDTAKRGDEWFPFKAKEVCFH